MKLQAQQCLVCDAITRVPIRDVEVHANGKFVGKTTYRGLVSLPYNTKSATFYKRNYLKETLSAEEIRKDTIFLFPAEYSLGEVIIWGKHMQNIDSLKANRPYLPPDHDAPHGFFEFDLAKMLDFRKKRDMKHLRQLKEAFRKIDAAEDPIEKAYRETLREQERQEQREKRH
ncbi:hypothetical protein CJ231_06975 [Hoylesella buccalis]|uniref:Uncharacterized protein n=2 Tax=Hoylesella buccalis TaxID=28127 RepID=A0A2N6QQL3_9BACT|nr:hypothetical protein CJ231_06975 [Hoylesella buccalis]